MLSHRAYAYLNSRDVVQFRVSAVVCAVFLALVLVQQYVDRLDNHKFYILVALALPALFEVSRRVRLDRWLGELSYPIYLAHLSVLGIGQIVVTSVMGPIASTGAFALTMAAATILLTIAYVHWVDAPFEQWRQRRTARVSHERAPRMLPQAQAAASP